MQLDHKTLIIQGLRYPLYGPFNVSRQGKYDFDIFKNSIDVGKDLLRTNVQWMSRFSRSLPLIGLVIGLATFSLKTIIIFMDRNKAKPYKLAAGVLFVSLSSLAISAFVLSGSAPVLAMQLTMGITLTNFVIDCLQFIEDILSFHAKKRALASLAPSKSKQDKETLRQLLLAKQKLLNEIIAEELEHLLTASQHADKVLYQKILNQLQHSVLDLVKTNEKIQSLCSPRRYLEKQIAKQSKELTLSTIAMTITVVSFTVATFCFLTTGSLPIGVSILLCINFLIDLAELTKNIVARCREKQRCKNRQYQRREDAAAIIDEALEKLDKEDKSDCRGLLKSLPEKVSHAESPPTPKPAKDRIAWKFFQNPDGSADNALQLRKAYSI